MNNSSETKTILVVANDYTTLYNFRLELLLRLTEARFKVVVALPPDERNRAFAEHGCEVAEIPLNRFGTNPLADFRTFLAIRRLIRLWRPVTVLTFTAKPNIYGGLAGRLTRTPYICNVTGLGANLQRRSLVGSIMLTLQKLAFQRAKMVFCQNQANQAFLKKHGVLTDAVPSEVLPGWGVNLEQNPFEPMPPDSHGRKTKFITIARIRRDKGYDELFAVIPRLADRAEFHIVGWYEEERYKQVVEELKDKYGVKFYENMPHERIHGLIRECDCLIHPSHHEGMSNVILEAAAAGRPCIVSDIPGCREGIREGETGYAFEVKNAESLRRAIETYLDTDASRRREMGLAARRYMEKVFSRQIVVDRYCSLIKKICDGL